MKENLFRYLKWWGILILGQAVAFLLFATVLSGMVTQMQADGLLQNAYIVTFVFDLVFWLIFLVLCDRFSASSIETVRLMRKQLQEAGGSVMVCLKRHHAVDLMIRLGIFVLNQLPITVFCVSYPISFEGISFVERVWIADAGFYCITGSALLGLLFVTLWIALLLLGTRVMALRRIKRIDT